MCDIELKLQSICEEAYTLRGKGGRGGLKRGGHRGLRKMGESLISR